GPLRGRGAGAAAGRSQGLRRNRLNRLRPSSNDQRRRPHRRSTQKSPSRSEKPCAQMKGCVPHRGSNASLVVGASATSASRVERGAGGGTVACLFVPRAARSRQAGGGAGVRGGDPGGCG